VIDHSYEAPAGIRDAIRAAREEGARDEHAAPGTGHEDHTPGHEDHTPGPEHHAPEASHHHEHKES